MTVSTITCEAKTGVRRQGAWGFEPVTCTQTVGLVTVIDAAGITHHACARFGHRADIVRRFGETILPEEHSLGCPARFGDGDCDELAS